MKILLTAPPAVGKSTVIARVIENYPATAYGIVAREMLDSNNNRVGFTSVNAQGQSSQFMFKETDLSKATVGGEYSVSIDAINQFVVPELEKGLAASDDSLLYVDEIGRAQIQSRLFVEKLRVILDSPKNVLASIVFDDEPWSREFKQRDDVCLLTVDVRNRSELPVILGHAYRTADDFRRLNAKQKSQVYRYLKQFVESGKFDSAAKIFQNALPYVLTGKIETKDSDKHGVQFFVVHGQTESHRLTYLEDENRFQCDCPLSNGRGPFEGKASICSHEMSIVLQNFC